MENSTFSPYETACRLGAIKHPVSGINWSYTVFQTAQQAKDFELACAAKGYRTRNLYETPEGNFAIQYHHYVD